MHSLNITHNTTCDKGIQVDRDINEYDINEYIHLCHGRLVSFCHMQRGSAAMC